MVVVSRLGSTTTCVPEVINGTATMTIPVEHRAQNTTIEYRTVLDHQFHRVKQKETKRPKDYGRVPPRKLKK